VNDVSNNKIMQCKEFLELLALRNTLKAFYMSFVVFVVVVECLKIHIYKVYKNNNNGVENENIFVLFSTFQFF